MIRDQVCLSWNSRRSAFVVPIPAIQSLFAVIVATSKVSLQTHSRTTPHRPGIPSRPLYTVYDLSGTSTAMLRPTMTEASFTSTRQSQPFTSWQTVHQSSLTWLRGWVPRRLSKNEIILWLAVMITETYAVESFRLKVTILGAFASYVTILLLPLIERTGIVPLTAERRQESYYTTLTRSYI
jgi:hypothetical protein